MLTSCVDTLSLSLLIFVKSFHQELRQTLKIANMTSMGMEIVTRLSSFLITIMDFKNKAALDKEREGRIYYG